MELLINGEFRDVDNIETLTDLLNQLNLSPEKVVVEHNGTIPIKTHWESIILEPGDRLEIVRFMGGG